MLEYLTRFFGEANWLAWLALVVPYSLFFIVVDTNVTWRCIRWFNAPDLKFGNVLPIRGERPTSFRWSTSKWAKVAMSLYLYRRYNVPGWQAISTMIILGLMEIYQLLIFSAVGVFANYDVVVEASTLLPLHIILPSVFVGALIYLPLHIWYFSARSFPLE